MKVKVLGTGCPKCRKLFAEAEKAAASSGEAVQVEKVESIDAILEYGVMMTPALVVNEEVKACGRIPSADEMVAWIRSALQPLKQRR